MPTTSPERVEQTAPAAPDAGPVTLAVTCETLNQLVREAARLALAGQQVTGAGLFLDGCGGCEIVVLCSHDYHCTSAAVH